MRYLLMLLFIFSLVYAKEVKVNPDVEKRFNIKTVKVQKDTVYDKEEYPAVVMEDPTKTVIVSSPVEGVIDSILVKKGSFVNKGQTVATVLSPEINQILSQIEVAKVKVQSAKRVLDRDELLYKEEVIPYSRYYSSKIEYDNAVANLKALEKTLSSYGVVKNGRLIVTSKVSGVVLDLYGLVGSPVSVGKEIGKIANLSQVLVITQVPVENVKGIKVNDEATIVSQNNLELKGKVILVDYQVNPETRRNEVRILVNNPGFHLKPNMFVNVKFYKSSDSGYMVPKSSIIVKSYKNYVIVKENGVYKLREVVVGKSVDDKVMVIKGLKEGDEVVVSGVNLLKKEFEEDRQ
jgi:cobalt-zinc-cadmium efflux system membrane fusion protein